jgi:murein L,D-transpeptidase YafK
LTADLSIVPELRSLIHPASLLCSFFLVLAGHSAVAGDVWVLVDTRAATLTVMERDREKLIFEDIAIGRYGKTYYKMQGDNKTPLGHFTITWMKPNTRYHRFLGLNYPDLDAASRALQEGRIEEEQWQAIRRAAAAGKTPPQDTPLGGYLGIHGLGAGDLEVHRQYNWTNGCIALTNEQIDRLAEWVKIGTPVEIR